jgi:hypothetical protein
MVEQYPHLVNGRVQHGASVYRTYELKAPASYLDTRGVFDGELCGAVSTQ